MSIIFDIKAIKSGGKTYENYGFSVYPLFSQLLSEDKVVENYVNSGIFQLPIYQGQIPAELIGQLKASRDPMSTLAAGTTKIKLLDPTLIIKCVDNQRERHFDKGFDVNPPSSKFFPQAAKL
jgi:hypothetical protein